LVEAGRAPGLARQPGAYVMTIQQPNEGQRADIRHVLSLTNGDRQHHRFDFSDPRQYRFAVDTLVRAGKTPERYPGLHEMLKRAREDHLKKGAPKADALADDDTAFVSGPQITNAGLIPANKVAGTAYHTQIGGTSMTQVVCEVVNTDNAAVLANGANAEYNAGEFVPVQTDDGTAQVATANMTVSLVYFYQQQPGQPIQSGTTQLSFKRLTTADPVVTQPVQKPTHTSNPNIIIGLARGLGNKDDVDYWFWKTQPTNTDFAVPLVGSVLFDAAIQPLNPGLTLRLFLDLAKRGGGHAQPSAQAMTHIYSKFSISTTNNKMLTWNLPATDLESTTDPVNFGKTNWAQDTVTNFTCNMVVNLVGQSVPSYASIMSKDFPTPDPIDGVKYIKPIQFTWHCLAAGTRITMADGTARPIEELKGGEIIRTDNKGGKIAVRATFVGPHKGPAIKLTMSDGKVLVLSQGHVLLMPNGEIVIAEELKNGDTLTVVDGAARIAKVEDIDFQGLLFNLSLGSYEEAARLAATTMFANGILVGDQQMQAAARKRRRTRPELVRASIDPIFLTDYESHLQDAQRAARA
jgi:hypothetical protein